MTKWTSFALTALLVLAGVASISARQQGAPALTVQEYQEIEQLYARYYHAIDGGNADAWAATFTADGAFNQLSGQQALKDFITNGTAKGTPMRHWTSNLQLTPVAGGIEGKVYVIQFNIKQTPITAATYSRYDDLIVKTSDGWRFKQRRRSSDTTIGQKPSQQ